MITQNEAKELLNYVDGILLWKKDVANRKTKDKRAGTFRQSTGYRYIRINNELHKEHRIIFLLHYGYMPEYVDHIDGNKLNNKIENLRPCSKAQNAWNMKKTVRNTTGVKGVTWNKRKQKYCVRLGCDNQKVFVGYYKTIEEATTAVKQARINLHGEFARHE